MGVTATQLLDMKKFKLAVIIISLICNAINIAFNSATTLVVIKCNSSWKHPEILLLIVSCVSNLLFNLLQLAFNILKFNIAKLDHFLILSVENYIFNCWLIWNFNLLCTLIFVRYLAFVKITLRWRYIIVALSLINFLIILCVMSSSWKFNQIQLESSNMNFNLYFNWNSNMFLNTCFILPIVLNTIYIIVMLFCYFKLNVIIFNMFFKKKTISTFVLAISPETQLKKKRSMRFLIAQCIWIFLGLAAYWISECVAIILITQSPTNARLVNNLSGMKWIIISFVNVFNSANLLIFHHPTQKDFIQFFKGPN